MINCNLRIDVRVMEVEGDLDRSPVYDGICVGLWGEKGVVSLCSTRCEQ